MRMRKNRHDADEGGLWRGSNVLRAGVSSARALVPNGRALVPPAHAYGVNLAFLLALLVGFLPSQTALAQVQFLSEVDTKSVPLMTF